MLINNVLPENLRNAFDAFPIIGGGAELFYEDEFFCSK